MTREIQSLLAHGRDELRAAGVPNPSLDAQLLLAEALGVDRARLLANPTAAADSRAERRFASFLARRCVREPAAYIVGRKEFWGLSFRVDRGVLVPRPETELLVERALAVGREREVVVDVGTGSGCIAVTLALERPAWTVYGTDLSRDALAVAAENREQLGAARVALLRGDLLAPVPALPSLIVANLPYVPTGEIDALEPEVSTWEPKRALDGGRDGLRFVSRLLAQTSQLRGFHGSVLLEIDPRQVDGVRRLASGCFPNAVVAVHRDLAGSERVVEICDALTAS